MSQHMTFEPVEKHPTSTRVLKLDFFPLVATFWKPGEQKSASDIVRPTTPTGFAYTATADGQTGLTEPAWPTADSETVQDGDVEWTAGAAGANAVTALTSPTVADQPTGVLTLGTPSVVDGRGTSSAIEFTVAGGVHGQKYRIEARVTAGGETLRGSIEVEVRLK